MSRQKSDIKKILIAAKIAGVRMYVSSYTETDGKFIPDFTNEKKQAKRFFSDSAIDAIWKMEYAGVDTYELDSIDDKD